MVECTNVKQPIKVPSQNLLDRENKSQNLLQSAQFHH